MSIHICIPARKEVWDGYGLTLEIHDWLVANVGQQASDMTDFVWGKKVGFYMRATQTATNPFFLMSGDRALSMQGAKFLHFDFRDADKAMMFKLAWGGQ